MEQDIRWKQRFQNFEKAILLLQEIENLNIYSLSQLEKEGIIQRFEYTLELSWKTLKDKMENDGILLDQISPKMVIKEAFKAKYINDIDTWLEMIDSRNLLSHTYDFHVFEALIPIIQTKFLHTLSELYTNLLKLNE